MYVRKKYYSASTTKHDKEKNAAVYASGWIDQVVTNMLEKWASRIGCLESPLV